MTSLISRKVAAVAKLIGSVKQLATMSTFKTIAVSSPSEFVFHIELNRPDKRNAMNRIMWNELGACFDELAYNPDCRAVVLSGSGKGFTAGIDLESMVELGNDIAQHEDVARKSGVILKRIREYQNNITSIEQCPKPVIAAVHGHCIGAGTDIIAATDIRFCTADAYFQIKEVDIGMAADVGTLQRLPKIIGNASLVNELAFTGRKLPANEAKIEGLVSDVFDSKEKMVEKCVELAKLIASKSPVAVQTTKKNLIYSRDHSVAEGLENIAMYNMTMLQSEDFMKAVTASFTKEEPAFSKL